jgi:hypothetical protein
MQEHLHNGNKTFFVTTTIPQQPISTFGQQQQNNIQADTLEGRKH